MEDDPDLVDIFAHKFKTEGFSVVTAKGGQEGIAMVEAEKPDLILSDFLMVPMDGKEMAQKLRAAGCQTPITFLTNADNADFIATFKPEDHFDYLIKANTPIDQIVAKAKEKLGV